MFRADRPAMFTTWTYKQAGHSIIDRGNRIRPERHNRKNIQKFTWRTDDWVKGFGEEMESRVGSMTIADVSPGVAIRRVILLYENQEYREAANFINRLNYSTFKAILGELPVEMFVDNMPHTLAILEALYARVFLADGLEISLKLLRPDSVVMQMVKIFAIQQEEAPVNNLVLDHKHPIVASCKKLLKVIVLSEPKMKKLISTRKRALEKSIKGLGQHGMVGTSDNTLMNLHEALKLEFERVIHRYKNAVQKLDELSLAPKQPITRSISHGPAPIKASHQRQLSLRQKEIQERLIKNKTLLNVIEPTLNNHSMGTLLAILQRRIEMDKDALFQFTQLRKEVKEMSPNAVVASALMRFSQGCQQILELIKEFGDDENDDSSTDISGYHSDSDSAIALSGSTPMGSTTTRAYKYNLLYRSVRNRSHRSSSSSDNQSLTEGSSVSSAKGILRSNFNIPSDGSRCCSRITNSSMDNRPPTKLSSSPSSQLPTPLLANSPTPSGQLSTHSTVASQDSWKVTALRREVGVLKAELNQSQINIEFLQQRERKIKERLAEQARLMLDRGIRFENVAMGERRPTALIRRYGNLYAQSRVDTLDALDSIPELERAHDLKSKILFSAVVLSFRSVYHTMCEIRSRVKHILQVNDERPSDPTIQELDLCISAYMKNSVDRFDLRKNLEEVLSQIWATLYDYPSLKNCDGLKRYVKDCVRLAWCLSNQCPPFVIEYEGRLFRKDLHVRFHSSNQESNHIKTYLWPTLLEGRNAKLAFYIEGRYLVHDELQFVENLKKDIDYFVEISKSKSVLVFPPILSKYRFLAHKAVDEYFFPQLCSFSIGQESRRQIIVGSTIDITRCCLPYRCVHEKLFRLSKVLEKRVDCICPARLKSLSFSFPKDFTMPSTSCDPSPKYGAKDHDNTLFKPSERRRNENRPGIRDRQKRPDKQIYVPRALREMPKSIPVENKIVTEDETNSIHENNQAILLKHVVCSKNDQEKQFEAVNSESIIKKKSQVTSEDETNSIQENNQAISFKNIVCSESDQEKPFEEVNSESNVKMEKQLLSEDEKNCIKKNNQAIVCSESDQEKHFEAVNSESNVKMEKQVLSEDETNSIQENNQAIVCSESDQEKHFKAVNSENSIKKENQVQSEDETNSIKNNQAMSLKHVVCSENDQKKNFEAINSESNIKKESQLPIEEVSNGLRNLEPEVAVSSISSSSLSDKICEESLIAGSSHTFEINILHNQISEKIAVFPQKVTDVDHFLSINADLSLSLKDSETQNPDNSCILNNIHKNTESLLENSSREYSYQDSGIQTTANISLSDNISKTSDINLLENSSGECKNEVISSNKSDQYPCLENEDSWETKFDDDGECLNPDFVKELKNVTGQMKVLVAKQNYRDFQPITENFNGGCDTIVELYDFPREFSTQDLVSAFSQFQQSSYTITWVDDCHALAVFSSPAIANQALILNHPFVKVRPIAEGIKESKEKARWCARNSEPVKPRPTTSAVLARRLVSGALGLKVRATKEQRDQERSILNDAKEKRRLKAKQKQAIWDGKVL